MPTASCTSTWGSRWSWNTALMRVPLVGVDLGEGHAVDEHRAARGLAQVGEQPHEGRLAGAVLADEGDDRPGFEPQCDVVQARLGGVGVGEADTPQLDPGREAVGGRSPPGAGGDRDGILLELVEASDLLGGAHGVAGQPLQAVRQVVDLGEEQHEHDERAHPDAAGAHRAEDGDERCREQGDPEQPGPDRERSRAARALGDGRHPLVEHVVLGVDEGGGGAAAPHLDGRRRVAGDVEQPVCSTRRPGELALGREASVDGPPSRPGRQQAAGTSSTSHQEIDARTPESVTHATIVARLAEARCPALPRERASRRRSATRSTMSERSWCVTVGMPDTRRSTRSWP